VLTEKEQLSSEKCIFEIIDFSENLAQQICDVLYRHNLQSVIIEGGKQTLQTFIDANLWDEARVFTGKTTFQQGIEAPTLSGKLQSRKNSTDDILEIYTND
jgi:diaminohydroxyphosphoribosylaminopyrimidine deaminase/5-amino-6-(5-phosphoribosylamino)uracil reductase